MKFFDTPSQWRAWLQKNHADKTELVLGFYKKQKKGITYAQALDEALCFGWIDAIRRRVDDERWTIRFTPRKSSSIWSAINLRHVARLKKEGRMAPAGVKAFEARKAHRTGVYSYENRPKKLAPKYERRLRANAAAWAFFSKQAPWYQRNTAYWVMSAVKEETRQRRLDLLIALSEKGRRRGI
jgi:uncharacterized protein YdeI (YjbR/CyaY-like superfamily)